MRGGAGELMILREGVGGGGGVGGRIRDRGGVTSRETGVVRRKTRVTKTTAARASRRRHETNSKVSSNEAGGGYRAEGTDRKEIADESPKWSGKDTDGSVTEMEAETAVEVRGVSETRTAMAWGSQGSRAIPIPGDTGSGGGET